MRELTKESRKRIAEAEKTAIEDAKTPELKRATRDYYRGFDDDGLPTD